MRKTLLLAYILALLMPILADASAQNCRRLFEKQLNGDTESIPFGKKKTVHINYKTLLARDEKGEPVPIIASVGAQSIDIPTTDFPIRVTKDYGKVQRYNEGIKARQRTKPPVTGEYSGLSVRESWISLLSHWFLPLIRSIRLQESGRLSREAQAFIDYLVQTHAGELKIKFSDNPQEFNLPGQKDRIAKTSGEPHSPIIFNSKLLHAVKDIELVDDQKVNADKPIMVDSAPHLMVRYQTLKEIIAANEGQSEKRSLAALFSILVHEAGHYFKNQLISEENLYKWSGEIADLFVDRIEDVDLNLPNNPWLKGVILHIGENKNDSRLLIFDVHEVYDVTNSILEKAKAETSLDFADYSIVNANWISGQTRDLYAYTSPSLLKFDLLTSTSDGKKKLIEFKLANYFFTSAYNQGAREVDPSAPWDSSPVQIKVESQFKRIELGIIGKPKDFDADPAEVLITDEIYNIKDELMPGDTWKSSVIISDSLGLTPKEAKIFYKREGSVNSGFREAVQLSMGSTRIENYGSDRLMIHGEQPISKEFHQGKYYISEIQLIYNNGEIKTFQPHKVTYVNVRSIGLPAKLEMFGFYYEHNQGAPGEKGLPIAMLESPKLIGPRPRIGARLTRGKYLKSGATFPLVFEFSGVSTPKKASLHGWIQFKNEDLQPSADGETYVSIEGFHIELLGQQKSPMVQNASFIKRGEKTLLFVEFLVPHLLNGKTVSAVFVDNIYLLDNKFNEVFDPSPYGFGYDVPLNNESEPMLNVNIMLRGDNY